MEYNYTTTGSTALRASMQIFTDETYTEAYLGLFETLQFIVDRGFQTTIETSVTYIR